MVHYFLRRMIELAREYEIENIFLFSHVRQDGDAKASALTLVEYFKQKGFYSKYVIESEDFCLVDILGKVEKITTEEMEDKPFIAVIVDTPKEKRIENNLYEKAEAVYLIDHHEKDEDENFYDEAYIDSSAAATCEIIARMLKEEEKSITPYMATLLYTGIYTDTVGFKYHMACETFELLALLMRREADTTIAHYYDYKSSNRKRMEGLVSQYHECYGNGIVGTMITKKRKNACSVAKAVTILMDMEGKIYFCACMDLEGTIFVELRSSEQSSYNVATIAKKYGGGGHFHASGFQADKWDTVYEMLKQLKE